MQLRMGQQLTLTPQLQQAIRLLQLSSLELQREIQEALESNLMLEREEEAPLDSEAEQADPQGELDPEQELPPEGSETIPKELPVDAEWSDHFESYASGSNGADPDFDPLVHQSCPQTLQDYLLWQLSLSRLAERDLAIATAVVDGIDEDGYLRQRPEDLQKALDDPSISLQEVETMIHFVQSLDPPGVGARNLAECLLIQLRQLPDSDAKKHAIAICESCFQALSQNKLRQIQRKLHLSPEEIQAAIDLIRTLNPYPGRMVAEEPPEYVVPDVFVRKQGRRWIVEPNPEIMPKLRINAAYAKLVRRADQSEENLYLKNHLQEARWFIKSIQSRNDTVLRVAAKIVELQQEFFERGEEAMKPLVLRDVAEPLGLHESTVSRVTTQKYMHTPRGTYEFKYFFSSHLNTASGKACSSTAIRAMIRKLIAGEPPDKPLSDSKLTSLLADQGIQVARRTVAKYREAMGIPSSNERKRLA